MGIESRIKDLRIENNYTQRELAAKIGLTPKMISFYEKGERVPPLDIIVKLVQIFNVSSDYLLGLSDKRYPDEDLGWRSPHIENRFGKILSDYRRTNDLSISDFSKKIGVSKDLLSQIEFGIYTPSLELLRKISELTGYSIDYLTGAEILTRVNKNIESSGQILTSSFVESDGYFHSRLEECCIKNGITYENVTEKLGLSQEVYTEIRFNRMPTLSELLRISYGFEVSVDFLLGKTDFPNINLTTDEVELLLNYRDCIQPYKANIRDRAEKLSIESINISPNAEGQPLKKAK